MTAEAFSGLLLRRRQLVAVPPSDEPADATSAAAVVVLEAELADRGHLLTAPLRDALAALPVSALAATGMRLIADVDAVTGTGRKHAPLFRRFPNELPYQLAYDRYAALVVARLAAQPHQPCMACGRAGAGVRALAPCAHLVCAACATAVDLSCCDECCTWYACPVCDGRQETDGPTDPWIASDPTHDGDGGPVLRALSLAKDADRACAGELAELLLRRTPLNPQDHDDLVLLLGAVDPARPDGWLPERIPLRESKAYVLALLCDEPAARPLLTRYADTATDVLRLLAVRSGGDPDLLDVPRLTRLPRPLRRALLSLLDGLAFDLLVEDLHRHPRAWKHAGELLHPFEQAARHPRAALAFAILRGTRLDDARLAGVLRAQAARHDGVRAVGDRLRYSGRAHRIEDALACWDVIGAARLLNARPGELLRHLDLLLARSGSETLPAELADLLAAALPAAGPGPLLGAFGRTKVRGDAPGGRRRVFFPRGRVTRAYAVPDRRPPLPPRVVARTGELLQAEAVRRLAARAGERYGLAVLDAGLAALPVPFAERASAASLVAVPRGSSLPMPADSDVVRLFLCWTQPKGVRTDLDLSVAFYDDQWRYVGLCDYTHLEYAAGAAVHSGDFTSAPAPHGATEYLDLDLARIARTGVRYAVPAVLAYNNVPFDQLPEAFAGFMAVARGARADRAKRAEYDARTVRQRFDLGGDATLRVPMIIDLPARRAWWADATLVTGDGNNDIERHHGSMGRLGHDLLDVFEPGGRATLWDLACWTAAARTDGEVLVRGPRAGSADGVDVLRGYRRAPDEPREDFALRIAQGWEPDVIRTAADPRGREVFLALVHGDLPQLADQDAAGLAYRLYPGAVDALPGVARVSAAGLAAWLEPEPAAMAR